MFEQNLKNESIEQLYNAVFDGMGEGIVVVDLRNIVVSINHAAEDLLCVTTKESIGNHFENLVHMEDENHLPVSGPNSFFMQILESGKKVVLDTYYIMKQDRSFFPAGILVSPLIIHGSCVGAIMVMRDMSKEKQTDAAKNEFISLVAHQLRTPLTAVKWYISHLLSQWGAEPAPLSLPEQKEYMVKVHEINDKMIDLVNAILNVSRIDLGTLGGLKEPLQLVGVAQTIIAELEPEITSKALKVTTDFDTHFPVYIGDPELMRIVFQNLLTNAVTYTPMGGHIRCALRTQGTNMLFEVADDGCGIPQGQQDKIFTKFFRTDKAKLIDPHGNGLGMYTIKGIIERAGGKIWFQSPAQEEPVSDDRMGTIFYVVLPFKR